MRCAASSRSWSERRRIFPVLRQYNPAKDFQIDRKRVLATHRVLELEDIWNFEAPVEEKTVRARTPAVPGL
jgi:hypothetical protein